MWRYLAVSRENELGSTRINFESAWMGSDKQKLDDELFPARLNYASVPNTEADWKGFDSAWLSIIILLSCQVVSADQTPLFRHRTIFLINSNIYKAHSVVAAIWFYFIMIGSSTHMFKAHLPVIIDYVGLGTRNINEFILIWIAAAIALIVYSSQTLIHDHASPIFSIVYASLVIGHFLFPLVRRTSFLYGVLLLIGIVATIFYALGIFRFKYGYWL